MDPVNRSLVAGGALGAVFGVITLLIHEPIACIFYAGTGAIFGIIALVQHFMVKP
jgi:hypothetical protein